MRSKRTLVFIPIIIILLFCLLYELTLRPLIIEAYYGNAPEWFSELISFLYPRFEIEKERFDVIFFLERADQVLYRFTIISIIAAVILHLFHTSETFKSKFNNFWNPSTSKHNITVLRVLFYLSLIYIFYDAYPDLVLLYNAKAFYKPVLLLKLLHISYPTPTLSLIIFIIYAGSCLLIVFNIFPIVFSIVSALFLVLIQGLFFSFEKIDHGFAPLTYASFLFPFLIYESQKTKNETVNAWPLRLITICIALIYLMSACEKLLLSGLGGISAESFRVFLQLHNTPLGMQVAKSNLLCTVLPALALLFQLSFVTALFIPRLKPFIMGTGFVFHALVHTLFNIGAIIHPWVLSYIFFIDWTFLQINFFRQVNKNRVKAGNH